jgi:ribonuclease-3
MVSLPDFHDPSLFSLALTHRSYANEHPAVTGHNERLEFLGDAILAFLVGEWLYHQYPRMSEAELTRLRANLVDEAQLSRLANELGLNELMRLGKGAIKDKGRDNPALLCDTFEAMIGAYYLDSGLEAVRAYLHALFPPIAAFLVSTRAPDIPFVDPKSRLQQWALEHFTRTPEYRIVGESGPAHAKEFTAEVWVENTLYGAGTGKRKQDATKAAAEEALRRLNLPGN